ncbi:MAG: DNA-processing protein DprA [Candidatus Cloacimonetes bacterium]|nr:DNA-processing protein DprA [Candidatus Cloacimonadota bacterium]
MDNLKYWIRLQQTPRLGIIKVLRVVRSLGEPADWVGRSGAVASLDFLDDETRRNLETPGPPEGWDRIRQLIDKHGITWRTILDDDYPSLLQAIYAPPTVLFIRGNLLDDDLRRPFAIVGTRKPSSYGRMLTESIAMGLARRGFTIVSGMAYGIDTVAHSATLKAGGRTVAVLACGLDRSYPPSNHALAERIVDQGALVSELLPGEDPYAGSFVQRNRIISGLSLGTLVTEGGLKSGALVTSKFALDQNRDVFALPGDVVREQAAGPLQLIRLGAKPVTGATEILDEYNLADEQDDQMRVFPELTAEEDKLYQHLLRHQEGIDVDSLYIAVGLPLGKLSSLLLQLDLKGVIKRMAGNRIVPLR